MSSTTDSGLENIAQADDIVTENITWYENLVHGARAIFIHPFLPFSNFGFDYKCLFSANPFCSIIQSNVGTMNKTFTDYAPSKSRIGYLDLIRNNLGSILRNISITDSKQGPLELARKTKPSTFLDFIRGEGTKHVHRLILAQLILCTILLCYFIFRDITAIINYIKKVRSKT